jgi:hypothetical protein
VLHTALLPGRVVQVDCLREPQTDSNVLPGCVVRATFAQIDMVLCHTEVPGGVPLEVLHTALLPGRVVQVDCLREPQTDSSVLPGCVVRATFAQTDSRIFYTKNFL